MPFDSQRVKLDVLKPVQARLAPLVSPQPAQHVRGFWLFAAAVFVLGAVLRFWDLDGAGLWMDEATSLGFARLPLGTILFNNVDNHPPLSFALQHLWHLVVPDPAFARVPFAAIGVATVAAVILMMKDLAGQRSALFCGLLLAVSTSHIYFSQEARMYSPLVLGLALAAWGGLGHARAEGAGGRGYTALYLLGGVIAIYSQILGLVGMGLIAAAEGGAALLGAERAVHLRRWFLRNILLGVLALPWLLQIPSAAGTFPGIWKDAGFSDFVWMYGNVTGYPGLGGLGILVKLLELGLFLAAIGGVAIAWAQSRRAFSLLLAGLIIAYPLIVFAIDNARPVLSNRTLLPAVIGITLSAGYFLSRINPRTAGAAAAGLLGLAGLGSSAFELAHHIKPEDYRAAYVMAAAEGYGAAPVITCQDFQAAAANEANPAARILYYRRGETMLYPGPDYWRAAAQSMAVLRASTATQIDAYLGGGLLYRGGLGEALASDNQAAFMRLECSEGVEALLIAELAQAGFAPVFEANVLGKATPFVILESPSTRLSLYARQGD